MRELVAADHDLDRDALVRLYAYPEPLPATGWVRANMVSSLDGAAHGADGLSGSISTPADRRVFSVLRGHADVVVTGAGTVRAEGYSRPTAKAEDAGRRRAAGQAPEPCLAVVTSSGDVPAALLGSPGRDEAGWRLLVLAAHGTDQAQLDALRTALGEECVLLVGEDSVDPVAAVDALAGRGMRRVLAEGGPALLGHWLAAGVVDELCLTTSPVVIAGGAGRIASGPALPDPGAWRLGHLLQDGGTLLARWVADGSVGAGGGGPS